MSSSEEETPLRSKASKKKDYKIKHALKPPRSTTYTAQSLYDQIVDSSINLGPEYQRDVVWSNDKQINLIDSIFRNFYIPPIIFAVSTQEDGTETRTCIDGKQRLTSIQKFMDGMIFHRDPDNPRDKYFYCNPNKQGYQLPSKYKSLFGTKQIVCIEYFDLSENDEREIFRRVQLGVALNDAEKMKALARNSKTELVQDLTAQYTERFSDIGFRTARDTVYRWIATACYTIKRGDETRTVLSPAQVSKWLTDNSSKTAISDVMAQGIRDTMEKFMDLVELPGTLDVSSGAKTLAPVDFVMCCYLVHNLRDHFSTDNLILAMQKVRQRVRNKADNVMYNSNVLAIYYDFIQMLEDGGEDALHDVDDSTDVDERRRPSKATTTKRKRKVPSPPPSPSPEPAPKPKRGVTEKVKKPRLSRSVKEQSSSPPQSRVSANGLHAAASAASSSRGHYT